MGIGLRVLVVDDDHDCREILAMFLALEGHAVECVTGGEEALRKLDEWTPDVIILDLFMPDMDGLGFMVAFQAMLLSRRVPVIAMSASPMHAHALPGGTFAAVIGKPFDLASSEDVVRGVVGIPG